MRSATDWETLAKTLGLFVLWAAGLAVFYAGFMTLAKGCA